MIDKADRQALLAVPAFRRFLFDVIQLGGVFDAGATHGDGRILFNEGRRSLALDVLKAFEEAQPEQTGSGLPILTAIQTLQEMAQSTTRKETKRDRRDGTYRDIGDDGE